MEKIIWFVFFAAVLLVGCSDREDINVEDKASAGILFQLNGAGGMENSRQLTRLYVVQKAIEEQTEHWTDLYCSLTDRHFVDQTASIKVENLYLKAYKFAFVSVPDYSGILEGKSLFPDLNAAPQTEDRITTDFTKLSIDISEVQDLLNANQFASELYDLNLYRGIVNRWPQRLTSNPETSPVTETVSLKRINGLLTVNMGILTDQFADPVEAVSINFLDFPTRVFVYDNSSFEDGNDNMGNPIEGGAQVFVDATRTEDWSFKYQVTDEERTGKNECTLTLPVLPHRLLGATITVTVQKQTQTETYSYPIRVPVTIKPNVHTQLIFHGMYTGQFEVQYSGFNDSGIMVGPEHGNSDDWIGWK